MARRIAFSDSGPGIADLDLALTDGYTTGGGLGLGLTGSRRLVEKSGGCSASANLSTLALALKPT